MHHVTTHDSISHARVTANQFETPQLVDAEYAAQHDMDMYCDPLPVEMN